MNVLYLSYDGMTDPLGQAQVIPYLEGLAQDHTFTLISFEKPDAFQKHRNRIAAQLERAGIDWLPQTYHTTPPFVSKYSDVNTMYRVAVQQHRKKPFDVVHCRSYMPALVGLRFKRKYRTKFIFDMRGFWADERVDAGLWPQKNPVYRLIYRHFKRKERQFLAEADYAISLTKAGLEEINTWGIANLCPITVIPCCADLDKFCLQPPQTTESMRQRLGLNEGCFVLSYVGSVGTWYMVEEMLTFYKVVLEKHPDAVFLWITNAPKSQILTLAAAQGLTNPERFVVQGLAHHEVPAAISVSNLSLFFIRPTYSKKSSSPTKMAEIMGCGVDFVTNSGIGDSDQIIRSTGAGHIVDAFTPDAYRTVLDEPPSNPEVLRSAAEAYFSLNEGVKRYRAVYQQLYCSVH